jgi:galactarate dehydratase
MPSNGRVRPLCIQVHAQDNVAIIANEGGLPAGTELDNGLALIDTIPEAHKVALCGIASGEPILRYGELIGYAEVPIAKGSWVHEGVMSLPAR